jgi:hypothetical protein
MPRFAKTFCSQCCGEFGPGDAGYSHCDQHTEAKMDRTFRFYVTTFAGGKMSSEHVSFNPYATDEVGYNEAVMMLVEKFLRAAKYDAEQMDLEDEQNSEDNRADYRRKVMQAAE